MAGIYLHIPFCKQACIYCNFHFKAGNHPTLQMTQAIANELEIRKDYLKNKPVKTIYFGGGTPSLLTGSEIELLLNTLSKNFAVDANPEITLECNPDDLSKEKLLEFKKIGINRLSIGVQSFNEEALKWMNRAHNATESELCIQLAQECGFENISIDIITGIPIATKDLHISDINKALILSVQHISCYSMTLEPNTTWQRKVRQNKAPKPNDSQQAKAFEQTLQLLIEKGWLHYEISNFALSEAFISRHNSSYWQGEYYLGVGPSAHSYNGTHRRWNLTNHTHYLEKIAVGNDAPFEQEEITPKMAFNEKIMTGLRTIQGINLQTLEQILPNATHKIIKQVQSGKFKDLYIQNNTLFLKPESKLFADGLAAELFEVD